MIARRAKFAIAARQAQRRDRFAASCNDNRPVRAVAAPPQRKLRPVLFCRWHRTPSGALECAWHIERAAADDPEIGWWSFDFHFRARGAGPAR